MRTMIGLSEATLGKEEEEALVAVLRSGWLSQGDVTTAFEKAFAAMQNVPEGVAVGNATQGLHLAVAALGIGEGDEVLVPGVTFVAGANSVLYAGAKPVPVDIEAPRVPHMSLDDAKAKLTPRTRAVMLMHYGGYRMDIKAWTRFADIHGLLLIEDAAHTPGLPEVGGYSNAAVFSFFANKNMTCAEGGMILTSDRELAERLRRLRGHAMTSQTLNRARGHAYSYDVTELGWNYRIDELRSALGLAQMKKLPAWNARRGELAALYRSLLAERVQEVQVPFDAAHPSVHHLFPVCLPEYTDRASLMKRLREEGVQSSIHYPPWHKFIWHSRLFPNLILPNTEWWCGHELTLPLHPGLCDEDVERVVETLSRLLPECRK
ncbi:MAG: DegT/DnrJ/EryC1/StrS aminotransferase family protein [Desulfovibrio sp.]|jgi:dTDP-4-amino-4,6-dideoxygalactose transaminase|nr:DegT/DnrJ/EryC1/StrS aminotransferase family protein [Desulfovibrio sp.]